MEELLRYLPEPTTSWMWRSQLSEKYASDYRRWLITPAEIEREGFTDFPIALRGSRSWTRFHNRDAILADRFCKKAAYVVRLTTKYSWEDRLAPRNEVCTAIMLSAKARFSRQRSGCDVLRYQTQYRFENGREIYIDSEPEKKAKYEAPYKMARKDDFWQRVCAARDLIQMAEKMGVQ
jgi:hypothetical protein